MTAPDGATSGALDYRSAGVDIEALTVASDDSIVLGGNSPGSVATCVT